MRYDTASRVKQSKAWKLRRESSLKDYLLGRIVKTAGCWIWITCKKGRYPTSEYKNKTQGAHRASYKLFVGKIPKGKIIRHKCDDSRCINPKHLEVGTRKDNRQDFMKRNPHAMEICLKAAKNGAKGVKKFWRNMSHEERQKFIKRRAKIQKEKYPLGARNGGNMLRSGNNRADRQWHT